MHTNGLSWGQKKLVVEKNREKLIVRQELEWYV
jgi:hypothetical protein